MVVAPNGVVYVNTWSGVLRQRQPPAGGFLVALQDTTGDGKADVIERFGETVQAGGAGGTGIALYKGALYAEINDRIVRYALPSGSIVPNSRPEVIVSGMPLAGDHPMHPFVIDARGSTLRRHRHARPMRARTRTAARSRRASEPCTELETRGGHLALRRQQDEPEVLAGRALRHGHSQRRGLRVRCRRPAVRDPARPGPARGELARALQPEQGATLPAEELVQLEAGRRLRLARVLLRPRPEEARAGAGIWRRRRQGSGRVREQAAPRWRAFPPTGRPNDLHDLRRAAVPRAVSRAARSSRSTARGTGRLSAGRLQRRVPAAGRRQGVRAITWSSPTGSPVPTRSPAGRRYRPSGLAVAPDGALYISDDRAAASGA